jgi:hypothetical protein
MADHEGIDMKEKPTPKRGQIWFDVETEEYYILVSMGVRNYVLINLADGMKWTNPKPTLELAFGEPNHKSPVWEFACDGDALKPALKLLRQS